MAQSSIERYIDEPAEFSTAAIFLRNDDALTRVLRGEDAINVEDLIRLARATSPTYDVLSSLGSSSTAVFSSLGESTITKPTSTCTNYPIYDLKGKAKAKAASISSLSATHGSGSEAETSHGTVREYALLAMGDWTANDFVSAQPLKDTTKTKRRTPNGRWNRHKKPILVIQQGSPNKLSSDDEDSAAVSYVSKPYSIGSRYIRHSCQNRDHGRLHLAKRRCIGTTTTESQSDEPLSGSHLYSLIAVIVSIALTITVSAISAYYTGKARMACTKSIVFAATVLTVCLTILAMMIARRTLLEALFTGLLEFVVGFALLLELDEFMRPL